MALAPCRTMPPHPPLMGSILMWVWRDKPWREWHDVGSMQPETAWSMFKMFNMFSCETAISLFLHPMFQVQVLIGREWFGAGGHPWNSWNCSSMVLTFWLWHSLFQIKGCWVEASSYFPTHLETLVLGMNLSTTMGIDLEKHQDFDEVANLAAQWHFTWSHLVEYEWIWLIMRIDLFGLSGWLPIRVLGCWIEHWCIELPS